MYTDILVNLFVHRKDMFFSSWALLEASKFEFEARPPPSLEGVLTFLSYIQV